MKSNNDQDSNTRSRIGQYFTLAFIALLVTAAIINTILERSRYSRYEPERPIEEILVEIEDNGSQADCSDLIGKWFVLETRLEVEFRPENRMGELPRPWRDSGYFCDDANRMAAFTHSYFVGDEVRICTFSLNFGKMYDDIVAAKWDFCSESGEMMTRLMVRQKE